VRKPLGFAQGRYEAVPIFGDVSCVLGYGTNIANQTAQEGPMLFTIAVILFIAWVLGIVGVYTVGSFIHALLVIALVLFVLGLFSGRRAAI
jgi:uncharacterized membrane protein YtjA (UPF0391 family)